MFLGRGSDIQKHPGSEGRARSAIFYHTPEQKRIAEESKQKLEASGRFRRPIVTEVTPPSTFYLAEDYHQRYLEKRGLASCHV